MKKLTLLVIAALLTADGAPAQLALPSGVQFALGRVEHALQNGNPMSIEDMFPSPVTMRLGDSLYKNISSITAMNLLKEFFAERDSIRFRFTTAGSGTMVSRSGDRYDTTAVDVWLSGNLGGVAISALNISNYPLATVFMDIPHRVR